MMDYCSFFKSINGFLRLDLTNAEFHTLLFIGERTIRYNKLEEKIPLRHFLTGVYDKTGQLLLGHVSLSKTSLLKGIKSLHRRGFIALSHCTESGAGIYRLVVENIEKAVAMIRETSARTTKKWFRNNEVEDVATKSERGSTLVPGVGNFGTTKDTDRELQKDQKPTSLSSAAVEPAVVSVKKKVEEIRQKYRETRERKKDELHLTREGFRQDAFIAAWVSSCETHKETYFGDKVPLVSPTRKELAIFKNSLTGLALPAGFKAGAFIEWCVLYWNTVQEERFYWMTNPPAPLAPDLRFFMRFIRDFYAIYLSRYAKQHIQTRQRRERQKEGVVSKGLYEAERKRADRTQEELAALRTKLEAEQVRYRDSLNQILIRKESGVPQEQMEQAERRYNRLLEQYNRLCDQLYGKDGLPEGVPEYDELAATPSRNR
jgi:hypothetical protein